MAEAEGVRCTVAYARPGRQRVLELTMPAGSSAREAVAEALRQGLGAESLQIAPEELTLGVYGKVVSPDYVVQSGDRVEIYRPLAVDPRAARRARAKRRR